MLLIFDEGRKGRSFTCLLRTEQQSLLRAFLVYLYGILFLRHRELSSKQKLPGRDVSRRLIEENEGTGENLIGVAVYYRHKIELNLNVPAKHRELVVG